MKVHRSVECRRWKSGLTAICRCFTLHSVCIALCLLCALCATVHALHSVTLRAVWDDVRPGGVIKLSLQVSIHPGEDNHCNPAPVLTKGTFVHIVTEQCSQSESVEDKGGSRRDFVGDEWDGSMLVEWFWLPPDTLKL